ncbi:hypothetical protein IPM62_06120 [Candidatus Woesebacteria bacterium]|nr:MAG: hypothetical protein IPM62_06120 [Candidatus Woesebacteria bacterium]
MTSFRGRKLHNEAEIAREKKQDFIKSLQILDEAILVYEKDGDLQGFSEALQSRSSVFKHLYQQTGDAAFLVVAKHDSLAGVEIAESLTDKSALAMSYRGAAKVFEQLLDWENAQKYFQMAVKAFAQNPPKENARPAVLYDMKAHLGYATFMFRQKKIGLKIINDAIKNLLNDLTEEKYNRDVWLSGAYMRLATMLWYTDKNKAKTSLDQAEAIINSNSDLTLRSSQLKKLKSKLGV